MALTSKLKAIADAIRSKTGKSGALTLDGMADEIKALKTSFTTQTKSATPSETAQDITPDANYDGLSKVTVGAISKTYVGSSVTKQAAKTVTPTKSEQTAVNANVYTTGAVKVGAIPAAYIIPSGSQTATENKTYDVTELAEMIVNVAGGGGGLPAGFKAIATGTHTLSSAVQGGQTFTVNHNLGETPDLFLFFATANIATTYSMLSVMRSSMFGWRSTSYLNKAFYHANSTTTVTGADVTTSYGIKTLNSTQAVITTYSSSTSYYWRAATYKWIAIKFG